MQWFGFGFSFGLVGLGLGSIFHQRFGDKQTHFYADRKGRTQGEDDDDGVHLQMLPK